jgi:hypothetical protein
MAMKHIFAARVSQPEMVAVGDLIRSANTGDFINIVLEVGKEQISGQYGRGSKVYCAVRSVRYGRTNGGEFILLNGSRSRNIQYFKGNQWNKWEVVDEYIKADNQELRNSIVKSLEGVNTAYVPPEIEAEEEE